jgi:hypothetical protein
MDYLVIKRNIMRTSAKKKSLPDQEYDRLIWVLQGRSKDETRKNLYGIFIEPKKITATDGHILLSIDTEAEYPTGFYSVLISTWRLTVLEKTDFTFPDYRQLLDKASPPDNIKEFAPVGKDSFSLFAYDILRFQCYSINNLKRVFIPHEPVSIEYRKGFVPLLVKAPKRIALVMPIKYDDEAWLSPNQVLMIADHPGMKVMTENATVPDAGISGNSTKWTDITKIMVQMNHIWKENSMSKKMREVTVSFKPSDTPKERASKVAFQLKVIQAAGYIPISLTFSLRPSQKPQAKRRKRRRW